MGHLPTNLWLTMAAFVGGVGVVWAWQRRSEAQPGKRPAAGGTTPVVTPARPAPRPASHLRVQSFDEIVEATNTGALLDSIERRTRLSHAAWASDCAPVLRSLAEYVQMLPASESHHHAQPGGLWVHMLEVVDAALAFRAGLELPRGVGTEDRKRLEHRCTYMVFLAALLHDIGKPVADLRVTVFPPDHRLGKPWAALTGPMDRSHHYRVEFAPQAERDYELHQRLPAILAQRFVPDRSVKWLGEEPQLLAELFKYLSGEDLPQSFLPDIVRQADSSSVRRNLLTGPRTRFATAKVVPLIERLMQALRRMLAQGGLLPLNKPGAVGWVDGGAVWFVCARLADDLRDYLAQHESAEGIPGAQKNDRIFDEFEDYGACEPNPDGSGAVWKIEVELDVGWKSPPLTVLKFPLAKLYGPDQASWPANIIGCIKVLGSASKTAATQAATPSTAQPAASAQPGPAIQQLARPPVQPGATAVQPVSLSAGPMTAKALPEAEQSDGQAVTPASTAQPAAALHLERPSDLDQPSAVDMLPLPPDDEPTHVTRPTVVPPAKAASDEPAAKPVPTSPRPEAHRVVNVEDAEHLSAEDQADPAAMASAPTPRASRTAVDTVALSAPRITREEAIASPQQPHQKPKKSPKPAKDATPAANAFFLWVQAGVASGHLKYNEPQALVHFVPEGMLLLSPGIFRRFLEDHDGVASGPVAALSQAFGDKAMQRLQNEVAKSPYTLRNGDENLHYYAFTKHDGGTSATSSFFLAPQPQLFFNPVPPLNSRIVKSARPARKMKPVGNPKE